MKQETKNIRDIPGITDFDAKIYDSICYWYETGETAVTPENVWYGAMGFDVEPLEDEIKTVIESIEKMSETWVKVKGTSMSNAEFKSFFGKNISEAEELSESGNLLNVAILEKSIGGKKKIEFLLKHNPILNDIFKGD